MVIVIKPNYHLMFLFILKLFVQAVILFDEKEGRDITSLYQSNQRLLVLYTVPSEIGSALPDHSKIQRS